MLPKSEWGMNNSFCLSCGKSIVSKVSDVSVNGGEVASPSTPQGNQRPCPKDLSSGYRSTPTIYNPSNKDTMSSSPYDDVQSMKETNYNHLHHHPMNHHHPHPPTEDHSIDFEDKVYRVNLSVIPVFVLEVVAVGSLAALAYFMRCRKEFSPYERGFHCNDMSINLPIQNNTSIFNVEPKILYAICFSAPLIMVMIGEIGYFLFSKRRKVVRGGCIGCRLHLSTRRIIRFSGVFLFGLLVTSIITDGLKFTTGRLRPYFLSICNTSACSLQEAYVQSENTNCYGGNDEFFNKDIRMSFPSYHASLSAYAAVFTMIYVHNIFAIKASRLLRPSLEFALALLALLCGTVRVSTHHNHWEDVFFGFLLGISIAMHLCLSALNCFQENHDSKHHPCGGLHVQTHEVATSPPPPLFFRYFRIPHVSYQNKSGVSYPMDNVDEYSPKPAINEAFQKDLHQRIEDYSKRQGYNM